MTDLSSKNTNKPKFSLINKTILLSGIVFTILFAAIIAGQILFIIPAFQKIEMKEAFNDIKRCINVINNDLTHLENFVKDWSIWDDSYIFVQDSNKKFMESSLSINTFKANEIDLCVFWNLKGDTIFSILLDDEKSSPTNFTPTEFPQFNFATNNIIPNNSIKQIIKHEGKLILIAAHAIVPSNDKSPPKGTLIFGRIINDKYINNLSEELNFEISIKMLPINYQCEPIKPLISNKLQDFSLDNLMIDNCEQRYSTKMEYMESLDISTWIVDVNNNPLMSIKLFIPREIIAQGYIGVIWNISGVILLLIVALVLFVIVLMKMVIAPITKLSTHAQEISSTGKLVHVDITSMNGEIELLATSFNNMIQRISDDALEHDRLESQIRRQDRMASLGRLAGGVAHDFNNQLNGVLGFASLLMDKTDLNDTQREYTEVIIGCAERCSDLIKNLLAYARKGKFKIQSVDINAIINNVYKILYVTADKRIKIIVEEKLQDAYVLGDAGQIENAVLNIAINSCEAMLDGGELKFTTSKKVFDLNELDKRGLTHLNPGEYICINIADTGVGISEDNLSRIFEPFFSTKEFNTGMGMGLAAVYGTIENHNGTIDVQSTEGKGTQFSIILPLTNKLEFDFEESKPLQMRNIKANHNLKILIVDDEMTNRLLLKDLLTIEGYNVELAEDGISAIEKLKADPDSFDFIILDMIMPNMSGIDTLKKMKQIKPDIKIIATSGFDSDEKVQEIQDVGAYKFLRKPLDANILLEILTES